MDEIRRKLRYRMMRGVMLLEIAMVRYTGFSLVSKRVTRGASVPYVSTLLLTHIGKKSGDLRTTPLFYQHVENKYIVVGSKGGAPEDPRWAVNLRANARAWIWVSRKRIPVLVEEVTGEDRARLWKIMATAWPAYDGYQERADPRRIPVFALQPIVAADRS